MAEAVKEKEKLERKSSKSRLSKQDEVEELEEEDNSPSSEASDATVIPAGIHTIPIPCTLAGTPPIFLHGKSMATLLEGTPPIYTMATLQLGQRVIPKILKLAMLLSYRQVNPMR